MKKLIFSLFTLLFAFTFQLNAQATLSLQGVIKNSDGTAVENGNYSLTLRLYNTNSGGTPVWEETQDAVSVRGGVYSVLMGESTPLDAAFDETYFLGISIDGGAELVPRTQLTSSPYALALIGNSNVFASDGNVGIGTTSPNEKLEVIGNVKVDGNLDVTGNLEVDLSNLTQDVGTTGNIEVGGNIQARDNDGVADLSLNPEGGDVLIGGNTLATGQEAFKIMAGEIAGNGDIIRGTGFTVVHVTTGRHRIIFDTPFSVTPYVVVTQTVTTNPNMHYSITNASGNEVTIESVRKDSARENTRINFIVIGVR